MQNWWGAQYRYKFICEHHGAFKGSAHKMIAKSKGCQCPDCAAESRSVIGVRRYKPASQETKDLAAKLREEGLGYSEIARRVGYSTPAVTYWLNPDVAEKSKQASAKRYSSRKGRKRSKERGRIYRQTEHGRISEQTRSAKRRLLETNTPEYVFLDNEWHEVDREETYEVFSEVLLPTDECKSIGELCSERDRLSEETGVLHQVDHIQPLSKGGEHTMINLQILPASENFSKHDTFRIQDQALICKRLFT